MSSFVKRGHFNQYKISDSVLNESRIQTRTFCEGGRLTDKVTVFISHKHDDLEDLKGLLGFLRKYYNIDVYIDSIDSNMPATTCGLTAKRIKDIIGKADKFILLATEGAIASKWCNWELGYGDAKKYSRDIAIFPFEDDNKDFTGSEYMQIYPYIMYYKNSDRYIDGRCVKEGFYVSEIINNQVHITSLSDWFRK